MPFIDFESKLEQAKKDFEGITADVPKYVAQSINIAFKQAKGQWIEKVTERYSFKPGREPGKDRKMGTIVARRGGGTYAQTLEIRGPAMKLSYMDSTPTTVPRPTRYGSFPGAKARVLSGSGMKELGNFQPRAFVTRFNSGHMAIVRRASTGTGTLDGETSKRDAELYRPGNWAKRRRVSTDITRIEELKTASMAQMFGKEEVRIPFTEEFVRDFDEAFNKALAVRVARAQREQQSAQKKAGAA